MADYKYDPLLIPEDLHPTISVGVAVLAPENTAQDLIARADRALYVAKADGKKLDLKESFHKQCKGCHQKEKKGPVKCDQCHPKK